MIKKFITYEDYNGNTVTDPFYFNMTKLELLEWDLETEGGLEGLMKKLSETTDAKKAYYIFKDILLKAYGEKSEDGKTFVKSPELRVKFESSPALGELIIEFLQNPELSAKFIEGILPSAWIKEAAAKNQESSETAETRVLNELDSLSRDELLKRLHAKPEL